MQKTGNEHYVFLPQNGQISLAPGTNFLAVASEGMVTTNFSTRIGTGSSAYVLESRGELPTVDLGVIENTESLYPDSLEGGENVVVKSANSQSSQAPSAQDSRE